MNKQKHEVRAAWARVWLLRLCRARLQVASASDEMLDDVRLQLARLRVRKGLDDAAAVRARLDRMIATSVAVARRARLSSHPLYADLAKAFALDADAIQVLAFICELGDGRVLSDMARAHDRYSGQRAGLLRMLGDALAIPESRLRRCLHRRGPLLSSGLLSLSIGNYGHACDLLEADDVLLSLVADDAPDASFYLARLFERAAPTALGWDSYPHLRNELTRLRDYLASVVREGSGAHVLLYGPPGTGKSELARVLARELGLQLHLVRSADQWGEPIESHARLQAFEAAQRALASHPRAMLLFDEIEDVFRHGSHRQGSAVSHKSWINRQLDEAKLPCIWIGNRTDCMDDSQWRRFDVALEITPPPRSARREMLGRLCDGHGIAPTLLDDIAACDAFVPAHYARAAKVLSRLPLDGGPAAERVLLGSLNEMLALRGMPPLRRSSGRVPFDLSLLRVDQSLEQVMRSLERRPCARLCLYGPPGTGKTALASHVADRLGRPLMKRRASDLLSPWVGETEARIAAMFLQAEREQAVLCLDEADSFLRDREGAQRSWEVTQVNELLTQLEDFPGVFIASTNLLGSMDAASLRRFDFKLRFDYMDIARRLSLFETYAQRYSLRDDLGEQGVRQGLAALDQLTPGDYAAVQRRLESADGCGRRDLLQWLCAEHGLKPGTRRQAMGFVV